MEEGEEYNLIIKTKLKKENVLKLLRKFDEKIRVDFMYLDEKNNFFELFINKQSIFALEMLDDIKNGNIPESFLGIEIVTPEVFGINTLSAESSKTLSPESSLPDGEKGAAKKEEKKVDLS